MPGFDKNGPLGRGSMTGRGMGKCTDKAISENTGYGRGRHRFGRGTGLGNQIGFGRNQQQYVTNVSEKTIIENEINSLKDQLNSLEKQLSELKKD